MPPPVRAALLCVLSCAFFAGAQAFAKAAQAPGIGPTLHPLQVTAARFLFAFLLLLPLILRQGPKVVRTTVPWRHVQRVLFGVAGVATLFAALAEIPLGDAVAIAWASPLFALLFAALFLKEKVAASRWIAAAVGFTGVAIMMRPSGAAFEPAALLALASALFVGGEVVTIRLLATRDSTLTILAINNGLGVLIACAAAAPVFVTPSGQQLILLAAVGVVMLTGQTIFLKAVTIAEASFVAPFYYATLIWAALIGLVIFGEVPGWPLILGASLIVASGIYVSWRRTGPAKA
ncbi:MAG: DMT family transporter [Alphaproteobacteria bacterium]|nr:DMT family transporter [Alphaproteobacteria bacterium]